MNCQKCELSKLSANQSMGSVRVYVCKCKCMGISVCVCLHARAPTCVCSARVGMYEVWGLAGTGRSQGETETVFSWPGPPRPLHHTIQSMCICTHTMCACVRLCVCVNINIPYGAGFLMELIMDNHSLADWALLKRVYFSSLCNYTIRRRWTKVKLLSNCTIMYSTFIGMYRNSR